MSGGWGAPAARPARACVSAAKLGLAMNSAGTTWTTSSVMINKPPCRARQRTRHAGAACDDDHSRQRRRRTTAAVYAVAYTVAPQLLRAACCDVRG